MFIMFLFTVKSNNGTKESPRLGSGDVVRLQTLFPETTPWKDGIDNHPTIALPQVEAFYRQLVEYYARQDVSDETYPTANLDGPFVVTSTLVSVFDDLIAFCEAELGLVGDGACRQLIAAKQRQNIERKAMALAAYRAEAEEFFLTLGRLKPPSTAVIRARLEAKRAEYVARNGRSRYPPRAAFQIERSYRDSAYKIALIDLLLAGQEVSPAAFLEMNFEQYGQLVGAREVYDVCCIVSVYLETPLVTGLTSADLVMA